MTTPFLDPRARLVDALTGRTLTGPGLVRAAHVVAAALDAAPPGPVLCLTGTDLGSVVRYLGTLAAGRAAILWDRTTTPAQLQDLLTRYEPAAVTGLPAAGPLTGPAAGYVDTYVDVDTHVGVAADVEAEAGPGPGGGPGGRTWVRRTPSEVTPDDRLGLLLGTSGSTGRPRLVRLSRDGVVAGAGAVRVSLGIGEDDVAITSLPLFYTYGLSVLHSHLLAGATTVIEPRGVLDAGFWATVDRHRVTSIAGVPHLYQVLARKPWHPRDNPTVRALTVSGGRMPDALVTRFHTAMTDHGGHLFVMYGQTEAGTRICVLPPGRLPAKLGSVGPPVPGMRVTVEPPAGPGGGPDGVGDGDAGGDGAEGEVVCRAASVMMGYAETAADLARGDDVRGVLRTGDHGRLDADGYLWLSGRAGRIGKVFGVRVNLDAAEHVAAPLVTCAALPDGDRILLVGEATGRDALAEAAARVAARLGVQRGGINLTAVDHLPRLPSGKIDYRALAR